MSCLPAAGLLFRSKAYVTDTAALAPIKTSFLKRLLGWEGTDTLHDKESLVCWTEDMHQLTLPFVRG